MKSSHPNFKSPSPEIESRIEKIISGMPVNQKISVLGGYRGEGRSTGCESAGVPAFRMGDGPMGVHWWCEESTSYPASIALASTFDRGLLYKAGEALGRDCRARGVHYLLAPGVNIYRSPLCGRNFEYLGEDPVLAAELVVELINGVQSQGVATTVKHFAVNFQEYDRHNVSSDVDERTLREIYLPAFEAAIRRAGSGAVMTAYNLLNGEHCSENEKLIMCILKGEWDFKGVVMSDWCSVYDTAGPVINGLDLEMPFAAFMTGEKIKPLLENGIVSEEMIDDKLRRILRVAACFGWLDNEQEDSSIPHKDPVTREVSLELARAGSVLLKNDGILPLTGNCAKIAVIGYHGEVLVHGGGGSSHNRSSATTTILEGIKALAPLETEIIHSPGVNQERHETAYQESEYTAPDGSPGIKAEYFANRELSGQPILVRNEEHIGRYFGGEVLCDDLPEDFSVRYSASISPEKSGRHIFYAQSHHGAYCIKVGDEVLFDSEGEEVNGINAFEIELDAGSSYAVEATYIRKDSWNTFRVGWEHAEKADLDFREALAKAGEADTVVLCIGMTKEVEGEGHDRPFELDEAQLNLIRQVCGINKNVVAVLTAGGNVEMESWLDDVSGLLMVWYPGQEGGQAVAEILFGEVNPSGKLPATFERKLEDRSSFDNYHVPQRRFVREGSNEEKRVRISDGVFTGYRHFDRHGIEALFPFGFGLSYTSFEYGDLRIPRNSIDSGESLEVSFSITNTGDRAGAESAQLYVSAPESSHPRPVKELKDFAKTPVLEPGESCTLTCTLDEKAFRYFDPVKSDWVIEPGDFGILVGASSTDILLEGKITVN